MALFYNTYAKLFQRWQGKTLAYNSINYGLNIKNQDKILAAQSYTYGSPSVDYPTPDNPRTLVPLVASGNWCVPCTSSKGGYWCFTLQNDIWEVDGLKDKIKIDMYEGTGYVEQNNWRLVLDGSVDETWYKYSDSSDTKYKSTYCYNNNNIQYKNKIATAYGNIDARCFSNRFNMKLHCWEDRMAIRYYGQFTDHPSLNNFYFNWKANSTIEQFKTWIASNPIEIVYHLDTPFTYNLTITYSSTVPSGYNILYMDTLVDGVISPENSTPVISLGELYKHSYIVEGESIQPQQVISEVKTDENGVAIIETYARDKTEPIVDMIVEGNVEEKSDWTNTESTESVLDTYIVDTISSAENVDSIDKTLTIETYAKDVETKLQKLNIDGNVEEKSDWNSASGLSSQYTTTGKNLVSPQVKWIYDDTQYEQGSDYVIVKNNGTNMHSIAELYVDLLPNTQYALSLSADIEIGTYRAVICYPRSTTNITQLVYMGGSTRIITFTTPVGITEYALLLYSCAGKYIENASIKYYNIQIEQGATATSYEQYTGSTYVRNTLNYLSTNINATTWTTLNFNSLVTISNTALGVKVVGNASITEIDTAWKFTSPQTTAINNTKTAFYISLYYKTNASTGRNIFNFHAGDACCVALITDIGAYEISSSYTLNNDGAWHNLIIPITVDPGFAWMQVRIGNDIPNLYNSEYIEIQDVMLTESATEIPYLVPSITPSPNPSYSQDIVPAVAAGTYKLPCTQPKGGYWEFTVPAMYGISDVKDMMYFDSYAGKGRIERNFNKYIFNGTETWTKNQNRYQCQIASFGASTQTVQSYMDGNINVLSNYFMAGNQNHQRLSIANLTCSVFSNYATGEYSTYFGCQYNDITDATAFKAWLTSIYSTNPLYVIYQLATPIKSAITSTWKSTSLATDFPSDKVSTITTDLSPDYPRSLVPFNGNEKIVGMNLSPSLSTWLVRSNAGNMVINEINNSITLNEYINIYSPYITIRGISKVLYSMESSDINADTLRRYVIQCNYNYDIISTIWIQNGVSTVIDIDPNAYKLRIGIAPSLSATDYPITFTNPQLTIGSTVRLPSSYIAPINISIPLLRAIKDTSGNIVVKDTFEGRVLINGVWKSRLTRNIAEKIFDGSESWTSAISGYPYGVNDYNIYNAIYQNFAPINCTHFKMANTTSEIDSTGGLGKVIQYNNYKWYFNYDNQIGGLSNWKVWLANKYESGNPLTLYYQLATPVITLGDPIDVNVYPSYTYLYNDSEVQPSLASASYISNKTVITDEDDVMSPTPEYPCNII